MERPKIHEVTPLHREVTGEIMYLDLMRTAGQYPENYEDLSDMAIQMHEQEAALYRERGIRPAIMEEYERYNLYQDPLEASCVQLADELLSHRDPESDNSFVNIVVAMGVDELQQRLSNTRVGRALELMHPDYAPASYAANPPLGVADVGAELQGIRLTVHGKEYSHKIINTCKSHEKFNPNHHLLVYPSGEHMSTRTIRLNLDYNLPNGVRESQCVSLYLDGYGNPTLCSEPLVLSRTGEPYNYNLERIIDSGTESGREAVREFADLLAAAVGDEPESTTERDMRMYAEYESRVVSSLAKEYLREWVSNTTAGNVLSKLHSEATCINKPGGDTTLYKALLNRDFQHEASNELIDYVNTLRARHNNAVAMRSQVLIDAGMQIQPWHDLVKRPTLQVRRARHQWPPLH